MALHLITEPMLRPRLTAATAEAIAGGADWVQVREKSAPALELLETVRALAEVCKAGKAGLLVNDRADVALAVGAHGVHLAKKSLPIWAVRALGGELLVGASVHSLEEAEVMEEAGADYLTFGSVFPTQSHPGQHAQGIGALREVVEAVNIPVLAIGGITPENVDAICVTGCAGIAVISAILGALDPRAATAALRTRLDKAGRPRVPFPQP